MVLDPEAMQGGNVSWTLLKWLDAKLYRELAVHEWKTNSTLSLRFSLPKFDWGLKQSDWIRAWLLPAWLYKRDPCPTIFENISPFSFFRTGGIMVSEDSGLHTRTEIKASIDFDTYIFILCSGFLFCVLFLFFISSGLTQHLKNPTWKEGLH